VSLRNLIEERMDTIVEGWVERVLSAYPPDAAVLFQKERDPFANPIGHSVREGARGILQAILDGMDPEKLRSHLDRIVRVRAVQDFAPSRALSFVFSLRSVIRDVIPELDAEPGLRREMASLDEGIDRVALAAFDLYSECREEVSQLRVNEVKRQVAWVFEKMNQRNTRAHPDDLELPDGDGSAYENVKREDLR
jgi:hypothetical protein